MDKMWKYLGIIFIFSIITAFSVSFIMREYKGNVALIRIHGVVYVDAGYGQTSSDTIIEALKDADSNPNIKAIILDINSQGTSAVAAYEIIRELDEIEKPKIAWIRETGTSGAYWIASACDIIVASPMSLTGSIGVTSSYLEFSDLFKKYGINYVRIVSGEYKDIGSAYKKPTEEELSTLQAMVDKINDMFVDDVSKRRNISRDFVENLSAGIILGSDAKKYGLVDQIGGEKEVEAIIKNITGINYIVYEKYGDKKSLLDLLLSSEKKLTNPRLLS